MVGNCLQRILIVCFAIVNWKLYLVFLCGFKGLVITVERALNSQLKSSYMYGQQICLNCLWPVFGWVCHVQKDVRISSQALTGGILSANDWTVVAGVLVFQHGTKSAKKLTKDGVYLLATVTLWKLNFSIYIPVPFVRAGFFGHPHFIRTWFLIES
jgi:hypothetical protein